MHRPLKPPVCRHCLETLSPEEPCRSCTPGEPERDCWLCEGHGTTYRCRNARCAGPESEAATRRTVDYGYVHEPAEPARGTRGPQHTFENGRCLHCGKPRSLAERYGWRCIPE